MNPINLPSFVNVIWMNGTCLDLLISLFLFRAVFGNILAAWFKNHVEWLGILRMCYFGGIIGLGHLLQIYWISHLVFVSIFIEDLWLLIQWNLAFYIGISSAMFKYCSKYLQVTIVPGSKNVRVWYNSVYGKVSSQLPFLHLRYSFFGSQIRVNRFGQIIYLWDGPYWFGESYTHGSLCLIFYVGADSWGRKSMCFAFNKMKHLTISFLNTALQDRYGINLPRPLDYRLIFQ